MRISQIKINNFKAFNGEHSFDLRGDMIFLVGENNTGKSSLFEAINFLKSGLPKEKKLADVKNRLASETEHVICALKLVGNIKEVIAAFSEEKYDPYIFNEDGMETLIIQRSSEEKTISQGKKKDTKLSIKTVTIWNNDTKQFENPSGIDNVISSLFETQFVWADTDPSDVSDFGSTKICGRLLTESVGDFFNGEQWQRFQEVHKETFHGSGDSLSRRAEALEHEIQSVLDSQYGAAGIRFNFSLPESSTFFKAGDVTVDDGVDTKLSEKGTGMQRAIALAMIQVYAKRLTAHPTDSTKVKPLFFFIDEPEICLHPKAQKQLIEALAAISSVRQIFITTHSPYLLKSFSPDKHDLFVFERGGSSIAVVPSSRMQLFGWSPSWGEINYRAYKMCTIEFHNELYGYLQDKFNAWEEKDIEKCFIENGFSISKTWVRVKNGASLPPRDVTLMTFIRNTIHHPENRKNVDFTHEELKESIEQMFALAGKP